MTLFPVIMPVIETAQKLSAEQRVNHLSRVARAALTLSAQKSGLTLAKLRQDRNGTPLPISGIYWSISHKSKYVAAVASKDRVGIDIEEKKPRTESLFAYLANEEEWRLAEKSWDTFFRYWTAKEATLKAIGIGVRGLKACRIVSLPDENHIVLGYKGQLFVIEQLSYKNHIISVLKGDHHIEWVLLDERRRNIPKSTCGGSSSVDL